MRKIKLKTLLKALFNQIFIAFSALLTCTIISFFFIVNFYTKEVLNDINSDIIFLIFIGYCILGTSAIGIYSYYALKKIKKIYGDEVAELVEFSGNIFALCIVYCFGTFFSFSALAILFFTKLDIFHLMK